MEWQAIRLSGQDSLAIRASKKLRAEEFLVPNLAGSRLRMELDRVPLWRGDHVPVRQLAEDFARYVYLPRLRDPEVLTGAVQDGLGLLLWRQESFAYADDFDKVTGRYRGLRSGQKLDVFHDTGVGLVVKPEVAAKQLEADQAGAAGGRPLGPNGPSEPPVTGPVVVEPSAPKKPRRYYGSVTLDAARVGRDAGRVAEEVIAHLAGLVGSSVTVTLEISAKVPDGVPENVVRTVTENSRALKFDSQGFENE
jgi:hypothetical protein